MSAEQIKPMRKRPPYFTTYTEVDVDIRPEELERAGWRYVGGEDESVVEPETIVGVVRRWHEEAHPTAWAWCENEPCNQVRRLHTPVRG